MRGTAQSDKKIIIPEDILNEMLSHCKRFYPEEACGILAGIGETVSEIYKIQNIERSPISYLMDSRSQFRVMKDIREKNLSMLAIFHSHTSSEPYPSQKDINLAFYPVVYIIIGLTSEPPLVKAYTIENQRDVMPVKVEIKV